MRNESRRDGNEDRANSSVQYKISVVSKAGPAGDFTGELTSPLLDMQLHSDGSLKVAFSGYAGNPRRAQTDELILESFQIASMIDYLEHQADVKQALADALGEHLADNDANKTTLWSKVRISGLVLSPPPPETPVDFDSLRELMPNLKQSQVDALLKAEGKEGGRTGFTLVLEGPWKDEHLRLAEFRDGQLSEIRLEG